VDSIAFAMNNFSRTFSITLNLGERINLINLTQDVGNRVINLPIFFGYNLKFCKHVDSFLLNFYSIKHINKFSRIFFR
jgi:hypothetical protein